MRLSTASVFAMIMATPVICAPISPCDIYSRDVATADESGAFKIDTGLIKDGVGIFNDVVKGAQGIKDLFSHNNNNNNNKQQRDFSEIFVRALDDELSRRDYQYSREEWLSAREDADESGAFKIDTGLIKDGVGIFNDVVKGAQGIKDFFSHKDSNQQQQQRDVEEIIARAYVDASFTRDEDESGAFSLKNAFNIGKDVFTIGKDVYNGVKGVAHLFSSSNSTQRRDFDDLYFRDDDLETRNVLPWTFIDHVPHVPASALHFPSSPSARSGDILARSPFIGATIPKNRFRLTGFYAPRP